MKFKLSITCDNAAFDDDDLTFEIGRCLRTIADRVEAGESCHKHRNILDSNGNIVGTFVLTGQS